MRTNEQTGEYSSIRNPDDKIYYMDIDNFLRKDPNHNYLAMYGPGLSLATYRLAQRLVADHAKPENEDNQNINITFKRLGLIYPDLAHRDNPESNFLRFFHRVIYPKVYPPKD